MHGAEHVAGGECRRQVQRGDVQREQAEEVTMHARVVRRRVRPVIAEVVATHRRIAGEPAGVVVEATTAARIAAGRLAARGDAIAAAACGDLVPVGGNVDDGPMNEIAARVRDRDVDARVGDQCAIGGRVGIDAQQGERLRAVRYLAPCEVRIAVAAEAILAVARAHREVGRDRLAVFEAVAVEFHSGSPAGGVSIL